MFLENPYSLRMMVLTTGCLMALAGTGLRAQQDSLVVDDRVEDGVVEPLIEEVDESVMGPLIEAEEPEEEKRGGWDIGLVISAAYDDNVFLSSRDPKADMVFRAAPEVAYTQGDEKEGESGFIKAAYRPTLVFYARNGSENRVDHQALLTAGWRGKVTRLTYAGAFQKLGDSTAETGQPTDRIEYDNEVRFGWVPREKVVLEAAAGYRGRDYSDPFYFDSSKTYGEAAVRFIYSPKTELGLAYQVGRFKVQGGGPQTSHELVGRLAWQPREKIRVNLDAGLEYRKYDNGSNVRPVLLGRVEWQARAETSVYVTAYMRQEASAFYAGQNYEVRGVTAGLSQRLGDHWTARIEGGYESNRYEQVSGTGTAGRDDRLWFVRPALVRRLGAESELAFFYRISDNESNDPGFGYDSQMLGVQINHRF